MMDSSPQVEIKIVMKILMLRVVLRVEGKKDKVLLLKVKVAPLLILQNIVQTIQMIHIVNQVVVTKVVE